MQVLIKYLPLILLLGSSQTIQAGVTVELHPVNTVSGKYFRLGDIAKVGAKNKQTRKRLEKIVIGYAPLAGYNSIFHQERIISSVYARTPDLRKSIKWRGSKEVKVIGSGKVYPAEEYLNKAEKHLQWELEKDYIDIETNRVGKYRDLVLPRGEVTLKPRVELKHPLKRTCVWMDVFLDDERYSTVPVWFEITAFKDVLVAENEMDENSALSTHATRRKLMDVSALSSAPFDADKVNDYWTVQHLKKDQILTDKIISQKPEVIRGDKVNVHVQVGEIEMLTNGIAQETGTMGNKIRVKNVRSGESYVAEVMGRHLVKVSGVR